jgi:DNA-binding transcriptional LysR family regulator
MRLAYLKMFCDVARCRSFSEAAALNKVSQSAVSQVVSQLEKKLGSRLIDRSTRPLQLTEIGKTFYDGCREVVERYAALVASIRKTASQSPVTVPVAAIYSVGLGDMSQYIERFSREWPAAVVHIDYLHPDRVYERVLEGTADFGLVSFARPSRELAVLPWKEERMLLVCSPSHPLASRAGILVKELEGLKYVAFDRGLTIRKQIDKFLREQGISVEVSLEFDNIESVKKAVEVSAGASLLPEPTVRREAQAGILAAVPLADCSLVRPLGIIFRRHHELSRAARSFISLLRRGEEDSRVDGATSELALG